jgi:hypothetical protein
MDISSKFLTEQKVQGVLSKNKNNTLKFSTEADVYNSAVVTSDNLSSLYTTTSLNFTNLKDNRVYRSYMLSNSTANSNILLEQKILKLLVPGTLTNNTFSSTNNIVNVNFLRKERLYTKLKYSRSPAYDIVSGGSAALLAAFLGFLISEKYGFEMVDSGDFYFLFMYLVFLSFSVRPLLTTINSSSSITSIFSLKPVVSYFLNLFYLLAKNFK